MFGKQYVEMIKMERVDVYVDSSEKLLQRKLKDGIIF